MSLVNPSQQEATTLGTHVPASSDTTQAGHHALNVMSESETNHVTRSADEPTAVDESAKSGDTNKIPCGVWQQPKYSEHPEGDAIRRQVEYYFSDENLPSDEHLLMKTGGSENLPVSLKHICGFKKMRGYKPYRSVVESLKKSEFLDIVDNKYIKRKAPLAITPTVAPQSEENYAKEKQRKPVKDATAPHLTKGMLKPTGFEEYFADPPVTPAVFAQEQELYDRDISFTSRIETAISRYVGRRKFHQGTAFIFNAFMKYGGIDGGQKQFTGGLDARDLEQRDAAEIAAIMATHKIIDDIILHESKWEVDFEETAKGFLSSQRMLSHLRYATQSEIEAATNVLRNFYNYLLHHNVCPEYTAQIHAARKVCDLADKELFDTIHVGTQLPSDFNSAVSRLHGGTFAGVFSADQTWDGAENFGGSDEDSQDIIMAAISALGTEEQYAQASTSSTFKVLYEEDVVFEVTRVEMADAETRSLYEVAMETKPHLKVVGKLHCRRWTYPLAKQQGPPKVPQEFTLFVEDLVLEHCFVGLKIEGLVKGLDIGLHWLDIVYTANPSFFVLLPNEFYDKQKAAKREEAGIYGHDSDDGQAEEANCS